jgi:hypothetical protein
VDRAALALRFATRPAVAPAISGAAITPSGRPQPRMPEYSIGLILERESSVGPGLASIVEVDLE